MNSRELKNASDKRGVSRLWLGVAAVVGAAGAYLADPERGGARREAAVRQVSGAAKTVTERAGRWRGVVSARLSRRGEGQLPEQVTVPTDPRGAATAKPDPVAGATPKPPLKSAPKPAEASAETEKTQA